MRQNYYNIGRPLRQRLTLKDRYAWVKPAGAYKALPAKVSVQIIQQEIHDCPAWEEATLAYLNGSSLFQHRPPIPKDKPQNCGRNELACDWQSRGQRRESKNNGFLHLSQTNTVVKARTLEVADVRAVPRMPSYAIEEVCEKPVSLAQLNPQLVAGIDLGIDNLATWNSNKAFEPALAGAVKNLNWQQGIEVKIKRSLTFVSICHDRLIERIRERLEIAGIQAAVPEDSSPIITNFMAVAWRKKRESDWGKRVKRGLLEPARVR